MKQYSDEQALKSYKNYDNIHHISIRAPLILIHLLDSIIFAFIVLDIRLLNKDLL